MADYFDIKIADNFFPIEFQEELKHKFFEKTINWHYHKVIDYDVNELPDFKDTLKLYNDIQTSDGFVYLLDLDDTKNANLLENLVTYAKIKFDINIKKFYRIRLVFVTPDPTRRPNTYGVPHVDGDSKHKSILYYVDDNDAETTFFNSMYQKGQMIFKCDVHKLCSIMPKQGRAVLFNGHIYHAGNVSTTQKRLSLNINFIDE